MKVSSAVMRKSIIAKFSRGIAITPTISIGVSLMMMIRGWKSSLSALPPYDDPRVCLERLPSHSSKYGRDDCGTGSSVGTSSRGVGVSMPFTTSLIYILSTPPDAPP